MNAMDSEAFPDMREHDSRDPLILIVYASYGEGHLQAARAIRCALQEKGVRRAMLVDLMDEAHPWIGAFTKDVYMRSFTLFPGVYGWVYESTRKMRHDSLFGDWLHSFGRDRMRRLLEQLRPDAVIHTFPMFVMPALRRGSHAAHIPSCAVVTDYDLHGRWVHPGVDRFYVPTGDMLEELAQRGIPSERICASGIPLKRGFDDLQPLPEYRERFGFLPDERIVLIMAGAQGVLPDLHELCTALLEQSTASIALVCGRNNVLERSIRAAFSAHPSADSRLRVFGYVDSIHELMAIASCLVTKPGGITISEGLAAGLPIIAYRPVPGQERRNAEYLARRGAAVIASSPSELTSKILKLMADPIRLIDIRKSARRLRPNNSAETLVMDFLANMSIMRGKAPAAPATADLPRGAIFRSQRGKRSEIQS
jgi:processive 1,2-diacylglycerol beta-glucosyltransferase